ncbi:TerB family tellurite resistance protein [Candidatus Laterigemmans baculatus]|nr:zinc-ribbon domain-containing protein [Candidatus Laterigemmans baculatus]
MNLSRTRETGDFYCPGCGTSQTYRLRTRRPFLTLYFIPVVPIGAAEPFVQCDQCRAHWDVNVLEMDRHSHEMAQREQFCEEAMRAAVLVTTADGRISEQEIQALHHVGERLLDRPISREELGALCSSTRHLGVSPLNYMLSGSRRWSQAQRTTVLQAAFLAASAEGELSESQLRMLGDLRKMFELSDEQYQTAIEEALELA